MSSTLHDDDRVFVNKLSYRLHDPNRGDVVVLHELDGAARARPDQAGDRPARRDDRDAQLRGVRSTAARSTSRTSTRRSCTPGNCGGDLAPTHGPRGPRLRDGRQPRAARWTAATSARSTRTSSSAGRSSCSGRRPLALAVAGRLPAQIGAELGAIRVDHAVDVVAEHAVDAHAERRRGARARTAGPSRTRRGRTGGTASISPPVQSVWCRLMASMPARPAWRPAAPAPSVIRGRRVESTSFTSASRGRSAARTSPVGVAEPEAAGAGPGRLADRARSRPAPARGP